MPFRAIAADPNARELLCEAVTAVILAITGEWEIKEPTEDEGDDPTV